MKIGQLALVDIKTTKYRFVFPKRTGKLNSVPIYPVEFLSEEDGILKPFFNHPLPMIRVGEIVMFLGKWGEKSSQTGLSKILYGSKLFGILNECLRPIDFERVTR